MDGSEQKNKLTDWKVQKVSSLDPKHFKRTLQNREYIAPEKMEAFLAFNEIDSEACDAGCGIDKFVASYNEIIKKLNKVKGKSDVFSLGRTISDIADKLKKSSSASRDQNEEIKLKRFIDKLTEKELAKRPTAEEALKDSYLAN